MSSLSLEFLAAAAELPLRQRQLLPLVDEALGRSVYRYWILGEGAGELSVDAARSTRDGQWRFQPQGLEVDVTHVRDGRSVRIDFAPGGAPAFQAWGVALFVEATRAPWRELPELKAALAQPNRRHSLSVELAADLLGRGLVELVDADLAARVDSATTFVPERGYVLEPGFETSHPLDDCLCKNLRVSAAGYAALINGSPLARSRRR